MRSTFGMWHVRIHYLNPISTSGGLIILIIFSLHFILQSSKTYQGVESLNFPPKKIIGKKVCLFLIFHEVTSSVEFELHTHFVICCTTWHYTLLLHFLNFQSMFNYVVISPQFVRYVARLCFYSGASPRPLRDDTRADSQLTTLQPRIFFACAI